MDIMFRACFTARGPACPESSMPSQVYQVILERIELPGVSNLKVFCAPTGYRPRKHRAKYIKEWLRIKHRLF